MKRIFFVDSLMHCHRLSNINKAGKVQPGRNYEFTKPNGEKAIIRDDSNGHTYPDDPGQNRGPHFNSGDDHYDY
jgi:hypothetical protein